MLNLFHMSNVNEGHHYFQLSAALDTNEYEKYLFSYIWDFIDTIIAVLNTVFPFSLSCKLLCVIQNLPKVIKEQFKTAWNLPTNNILSLLYTLYKLYYHIFPGGPEVKKPPAVQATWLGSLGWEDALEKGPATHSSILAWRIPMDRGACRPTDHGVAELDMTERLSPAQSDCPDLFVKPLTSKPRDLEDQRLSHKGGIKLKYLSR